MLRLSVLIAALLIASGPVAQPLMTLEDAIALGLKNNYSIQIARNTAKIAENNRGKGTAGFLPTIDISGGYSQSNSDQDIDLPPSSTNTDIDNLNASATLSWTLFDGFQMFINRSQFNELAALGKYRARDQIENSIVAISQAYFNLVQQEQLMAVAREVRDISATRLEREKVRNELGGASSTDLLNARVAFNSDESALLLSELQVVIAREQLNVLLGQDPATEFSVSTEIVIPGLAMDLGEVRGQALAHNASLKAVELNKKVADLGVKRARSSFMPRLSAYASYGYSDQTRNSDGGLYPGLDVGTETTDATVGLSLSFNLFNGRRDRIDLQNAQIEANNQALALRDARNRLIGLAQETFDTYHQRMRVVELEAENIEAARRNLELQQERNDLGVATSLEFRDAQVSFTRVQTSLITARYQARISRLELQQLIGMLDVE